ncbi:hypothetical protein PAL_GLEAN10003162 [Pteropus alecto]|uniref:Uncharacterized protein n=1 Tax=Pteropus alecto TaxID=9402 RepID=L5KZW9_PTEAL|nr:hypothetical protein PAL_GLEAN10003162 [Pteropus alecto]
MKLLENLSFEVTVETGDAQMIRKIESYFCKMAGRRYAHVQAVLPRGPTTHARGSVLAPDLWPLPQH